MGRSRQCANLKTLMGLVSRIAATVVLTCQCIVWACPMLCSTSQHHAATDALTAMNDGHAHHHSETRTNAIGTAAEYSSIVEVRLIAGHCEDCVRDETTGLSASSNRFPSSETSLVSRPRDSLVVLGAAPRAAPHAVDTSPPSGIAPLRI